LEETKPFPKVFTPMWVIKIQQFTRQVIPEGFTGKIELNILQGGVTSTNVTQSYRQ